MVKVSPRQRIVSKEAWLAMNRRAPVADDSFTDEAEPGALTWQAGEPTAKIKRPIFDTDLSFKGVAATNQPPPNPYEPRPPRERMSRRRLTGRKV
jgi:hypothetical protein